MIDIRRCLLAPAHEIKLSHTQPKEGARCAQVKPSKLTDIAILGRRLWLRCQPWAGVPARIPYIFLKVRFT